MEDPYKHPVFFECPSLDEEQRKRIENYFHIRRKSGGGDCGSITNIHDKVYSIAFKEREAQRRVLQRSEHVLEFAGGPLVLTVRGSPEPSPCSPITTLTTSKSVSPNLDSPSSQQRQQSSLTSSLLSGEEYEVQVDTYLLRYFKECPKAGEKLQKEFASVACSAQLYPQEGRVSVRRLAQPGAAGDDRDWKTEVDKLFDGYLCHYEADPHKVKALLQSCSTHQSTDEVKVYSEVGMAVVVGERSQVNARLMNVEDRSGMSEKQTSIRRLGEAKLRLLWKEIEHSLGRDCPGVKVTQGAAGQLVLEGSAEEILKAGDWISDQEKWVLEKTVSDMSPRFLVFLRRAYGGPGVLGHFLGVGDKVEVELRDTEIRLFSLSADELNNTDKKLHEKFKGVKIDVPNCSAVPSELQEKLKSKTNEMNQGQYRAQVVFGSDSSVCLLGHTKEVEELSEAVAQFILDQSSIEGQVILPYPELAQELPGLLQLHGFDYAGVIFHPLTFSSEPMLVLEGPSSKVTEVRNRLGPFLDSLVQDKVIIDLPGAVRYFESSCGRENILSVARSQKCIIQPQEQHHATRQILASGDTTVARYSLRDGFQVLVCQGDITKQDADALVNAANEDLDHGGGVAAALSKAGGPQVQKESRALVKQTGKIPTGDVVVTTGGNLQCKKLLHAVGPVGGKSGGREGVLLEKTVQSALNLAEMMEFRSIAIPCISSGVFGVPVTVCSEAIVTAVKKFGSQGGRSLSRVILIDNRGEVVRAMQEACDRLLQGISTGNSAPRDLGFQVDASAQDTAGGATAGAPGGGVHVEIIQGTIETQQVDGLVSPMFGHDPLSTRVGNILSNIVGPQLTAKFHKEAGGATLHDGIVLVDGLPALQSKAVFFLNLLPWDNNQQGTAVQVLRQGIRKMLASCQIRGFSSVALPVLGTGAVLRFPHSVASRVVLEEIREFEQNRVTRTSFLVRVVIHPNDKESSKAFQSAQETLHLGGFTNDANPDQEKAKQKLKKWYDKCSRASSTSAPQVKTFTSSKPPPAVISVIGCGADIIRIIKRDLEGFLQKQLVEREVDVHEFSRLDAMELEAVQAKVKVFGISLEHKRRQSAEDVNGNRAGNIARDRSGSGREVYVLKGLKEDVLSVTELVNQAIQKSLCEDLQDKEEAMLALDVQWSIQDINKAWHELSLHDNYVLEEAHMKKQVSVDVMAPDGKVTVNLMAQEATNWLTGITYKVKRSKSETTLELPTQWEPMNREVFKKVELHPNSPEYQVVATGFHKTARYNILKIERVQNLYLWHAYSVCRQRIFAKNGPADLGEMSLYHGTSAESCSCIERDRFDRSYAGAHATAYGKGVYFAVNAGYSASNFSPADTSGLKRLYVARVLTGRYTVGNSSMKATPPRGSDPTDCFDSLVNNQQQPTMFVIFHDDQAYPEYLITFS
ncbi:protein mono-ADP-ribosyltransferase PARP14-like isoform X4 [Sander lucioperca]|uniref:protein mono-ADP-ribosyltransferase PARP14-like isoform X4 n=1 Tax=Sander lucioperca TaxID=283035 RepID=UPI00125DCEC4|nr:protein mono-ADP-ribosyltransferase PARP14-like isoform X4 [Sander lucioperca]